MFVNFAKHQIKFLLVAIICLGLISGCGGNTASPANQGIKGSLTLYTSQPERDVQTLVEKFNAKHPGIKVNIFRSGTEEVISKLLAEKQANAIQADVLLVADSATFEALKKEQLLLPYKSAELKNIRPEFYDSENMYVGTKIIATGIAYNTKNCPTPPTSFQDLTKPEFQNKLIMPSPLYSGAAAYNLGVLTRTPSLGWKLYETLKANGIKVEKGNGTVQKAIVEGQFSAGMLVDYMALRSKEKGAPIDFVYPAEGALVITEPVGIIKGTKNEAAAKAFLDFIISEDGQKTTAEIGYTPIRNGVKAPAGFKSVDEIKVLSYDIKILVNERNADKQKFTTLFN